MVHCVAPSCKNNSLNGKLLSWHSLPVNKPWLLKQWLVNIGREDMPTSQFSRLCSDHFEEDCFIRDYRTLHLDQRCKDGRRKSRKLKAGAIPTIFKPSLPTQASNEVATTVRPKTTKHHMLFANRNQFDLFSDGYGMLEQLTATVRPFVEGAVDVKNKRKAFNVDCDTKDECTQTTPSETSTVQSIPGSDSKLVHLQPLVVSSFVAAVIEIGKLYVDLQFVVCDSIVEFSRRGWHGVPCVGQTPVKLQFFANGEAWRCVVFQQPQMTRCISGNQVKTTILHKLFQNLSVRSGFLFCCGLQTQAGIKISSLESKPYVEFHYPCHRQQSANCVGYFPASSVRTNDAQLGLGTCSECLKVARELQQQAKEEAIHITQLK